jgi:hypothetical protein
MTDQLRNAGGGQARLSDYFAVFVALAQRAFCAAAILARASGESWRFFGTDLAAILFLRPFLPVPVAGFVPATRLKVFEAIKHLKTPKCPFENLPEKEPRRWGQGLTAKKMHECVWVQPEAIAQIEFLEWTGANRLRHTKFVGLREDKEPRRWLGRRSLMHRA